MPRFSDTQRRLRLARRHLLDPSVRSTNVVQVAESLVGLHATDPATVYLAARARMLSLTIEDLETALYDDRVLLKVLGMRRTMFVVPVDVAALLVHGCALPFVPGDIRKLEKLLSEAGVTDEPGAWVERVMAATEDAILRRGPILAVELSSEVPELGMQIPFGPGREPAVTVGISTRVLFLLATTGRIVRSRPRGTWRSSQYRWVGVADWLGGPLQTINRDEARAQLAVRWLRTYGPATIEDLKWWSGWTMGQTRAALDQTGTRAVDLEGGQGIVLEDDLDLDEELEPSAWFLPALDPTIMGWKHRDWYLGSHRSRLFDTNGNAGPTIWWAGRVVGGWGQQPAGTVVYRLLEDPGDQARTAISNEAHKLETWLQGTTVIPRFRTPLERELSS